MKNKLTAGVLATAVVAGGTGFFGGMKYQQSKLPNFAQRFGGNRNDLSARPENLSDNQSDRRFGGFRPISGTITSQDENSVTIELNDGGSKIIILGDSTTISTTRKGSKDDLAVGNEVAVFGTENDDGSLTAANIQLNPEFRFPDSSPAD